MGGSGWTQTGPYRPDLVAAFRQAQREELARDNHGFEAESVDELWENPDWQEYVFTGGTATVLDFPEIIAPTDPDDGPFLRPLTPAEIKPWSPTTHPTLQDWEEALDTGALPFPNRSQGNCTILYEAGVPSLIGYWGVTSD